MKKQKSIFFAAALVASLLPASARAESVFLLTGSDYLPSTLNAGDSGTTSLSALGVWMEPEASGATRVEVILPEFFTLSGDPQGAVWNLLYGYSRSDRAISQVSGLLMLRGNSGSVTLRTASDWACGLYGFAIDPTDGIAYALMGRTGSKPSGDCSTWDRWLTKYNPATGKFEWISQLSYFNGLEFMADGTLIANGGNNSANGRESIYTVNKTSGAATYRLRPTTGSEYADSVYNPGDGMLYGIDRCYIERINPADWSVTYVYSDFLCNLQYASAALVSDNRFLVQNYSGLSELVIDPSNGEFVSFTGKYAINNDWPRAPMIASDTNIDTVSKNCGITGTGGASCTFGSVNQRASVFVSMPLAFAIPPEAKPGVREGEVRWYRDSTLLGSQKLTLNVLSPDVALTMTPASNRYMVGNNDTLTIDVEAVGGKDVNDVIVDVAIPSNVLIVTGMSSPGTCGLTRTGVRCSGIDIAAGNTETVTIDFKAGFDGHASVNAVATAPGGDVDSSNDSAASTFVVGNAADLESTGTKGGAGKIGTAMNLQVKVASRGPDNAVNSSFLIPGDAGFDLGTATTDTGTCAAAGGDIKCTFGTMALNTTATVSLKVTPKRAGNLKLALKASSDVLDLTPGNNTYNFEVSVPTAPFAISLGAAMPSSSSGDVRSVLQFAVTPDAATENGVEIAALSGTLKIADNGLSLKRKVFVFADLDANGVHDETDTFMGSASLSAESDSFTVEFAKPISAPAKKTTNYILAVQAEGAPRIAVVPFGGSTGGWVAMVMAAMLPLAVAGFAFGRRRSGLAVLGLMAVGLVGACSDDVEDLLANAKVAVTITSVEANLQGDTNSPVAATGLPLTGNTVTLSR